jgi:hypothetical protein
LLWQKYLLLVTKHLTQDFYNRKKDSGNKDRQIAEAKKQALMAEAGYTTNS